LRGGTAVNAAGFAPALRVNVGFRDRFLPARAPKGNFLLPDKGETEARLSDIGTKHM
jgi:hypothetical protein